ncbi:MAG: PAP/fibrillin family protein [Cyanobacteria bacterium J06614_10]
MLSKIDLKNAIAAKNRGILATEADRQVIASIIARVEDTNPTPEPLSAPELLAGDWRLLYTTSQELLGIDRVPLASLGNIYQCVRPKQSRIYNIAEVKSLPLCEGLVSVVASFSPAPAEWPVPSASAGSASASGASGGSVAVAALSTSKVNVKFERAVFGLQRALGYTGPAQHIRKLEAAERVGFLQGVDFSISSDREPGWLKITYLDEDLRIGRGNQGSLFVLTKDAPGE